MERYASAVLTLLADNEFGPWRYGPSEADDDPVPVRGLFETHLTVRTFEARCTSTARLWASSRRSGTAGARRRILWIGGHGRSMLGLWGIGSAPLSINLTLRSTSR